MARAEQTIEIEAPLQTVFEVVCDFEHYPEFVPYMERVEMLRADGPQRRVRFTLNLIRRISYTLDITILEDLGMDWTLVDGPFKHNDGGWRLERVTGAVTRASYFIDASLKGLVPGAVQKLLITETLPNNLRAFRDEAQRRAGGAAKGNA